LFSCRKVFVFLQQIIASLAKVNPERGVKLYLEGAITADKLGALVTTSSLSANEKHIYGEIAYELISQSFVLYEEHAMQDSRLQCRCVTAMIGTLLACRSLSTDDYENLIMKTSKYAAKMLRKPEQCEMVALCSHLFYVIDGGDDLTVIYSNPQRCLECLQRALKLADACTNTSPANLRLFVTLLDLYLYFYEKKNPSVSGNYITGLVALIKEHADNFSQLGGGGVDSTAVEEAKGQFLQIVRHINTLKQSTETAEQFAGIDVSNVQT
jgi:vacuolar protein sorting-associated protein 35